MKDIILILIVNISAIVTVWLREYYIKKKLQETSGLSPIKRSEFYLKLTHICGEIKRDLKADGVFIAYFHNGDHYKNGLSIDKFTVVAEDYNTHIGSGYISKYQNKTINYITYLYHRLLTDDRCYKENIPTLKMIDNAYKEDCLQRNVISTYTFIIKNADEDPIGFISLEYTYPFEFKKEYESFIWKHQLSTSKNIKNITSKHESKFK